MRFTSRVLAPSLAGLFVLGTVSTAPAWERHGYGYGYGGVGAGYGPARYDGGGYGFAGEAIGGDYIGAPFTRFPSPSAIVPPAWGYGTYGVPTATGIRQAPTAPPTLTVIDADPPSVRRGRAKVLSRGADGAWQGGGASGGDPTMPRVIAVRVPRR